MKVFDENFYICLYQLKPKKMDILEILYKERERLNQQYSTEGWNLWACIGALAALVWMFISQFEESIFITEEIVKIFIVLFTSYYLIKISFKFILSSRFQSKLKNGRYESVKEILSNRRLIIALNLIIIISFLFFANKYHFFEGINKNIFLVTIWIIIVIGIISFILSFINVYMPSQYDYQTKVNVLNFSLYGTLFFLIVYLTIRMFLIIDFNNFFILPSIKFALILFSFHYLIKLLYNILLPQEILEKMDDLIMSAIHGQKTENEILNDLEVINLGLKYDKAIEKQLLKYFGDIEAIENHFETLNDALEKTKERIKNNPKDRVNESDLENLKIILTHNETLNKLIDNLDKYLNIIRLKSIALVHSKSGKSDLSKLGTLLKERFKIVKEREKAFYEKYKLFIDQVIPEKNN